MQEAQILILMTHVIGHNKQRDSFVFQFLDHSEFSGTIIKTK